jgi:hypothetical protein
MASLPNAPYDKAKMYNIPVPAPGEILRVAVLE